MSMKAHQPLPGKRSRNRGVKSAALVILAGFSLLFLLRMGIQSLTSNRRTEYISMAVVLATAPPNILSASSEAPPQRNPQATWIIQTIDSSKFREDVFRRLQATASELKPTSVDIALQQAEQPADTWNIFVMGPEAEFTKSYLEATLDELVKTHFNNPGPGDLRIIDRSSPAFMRE